MQLMIMWILLPLLQVHMTDYESKTPTRIYNDGALFLNYTLKMYNVLQKIYNQENLLWKVISRRKQQKNERRYILSSKWTF